MEQEDECVDAIRFGRLVLHLSDGELVGVVFVRDVTAAEGDDADVEIGRGDILHAALDRPTLVSSVVLHRNIEEIESAEHFRDPGSTGF